MKNWKKGAAYLLAVCMLTPVGQVRAEETEAAAQMESTENEDIVNCEHEWQFDEELGSYDVEKHFLVCSKCGEKQEGKHNFTSEIFGLKVCEAGCMVNPALLPDPDENPDGDGTEEGECIHEWQFDEELGSYDLEAHFLVCSKCGDKKTEAHTLTGMQFLGLDICTQGCLLNLGGGEEQEPIEEDSFPLESYYLQRGTHSVKSVEFSCEEDGYSQYKIWYPADMETSGRLYPVVVMCNGTGSGYAEGMTDWEGYRAHFEHMASWGFIVVANDEMNSFSGESAVKGAKLLLDMNGDEGSIFHDKVDVEKIGVTGHSQGGAGCLNAATKHGGQDIFKSVFSVSCANLGLATGLWGEEAAYDISQIQIPCCFVAGIGQFEDIVSPLFELQANYDKIPEGVSAVMMRRKNCEHGQMLTKSDGYLVAWFLYTLYNDSDAAKVFVGDAAEIIVNTNWQDVQSRCLGEVPEKPEEPTPVKPMPEEATQNDVETVYDMYEFTRNAPMQVIKRAVSKLESCMDPVFYSALYPDLQEAFHEDEALLKEHFLKFGLLEGRIAIPFLDIAGYKERYPDLQAAFGEDWNAYLKHYLIYGIKEGRDCGTWFDASAYVERYPDLKKAFGYDVISLYNHYVIYGRKEGRNPARHTDD